MDIVQLSTQISHVKSATYFNSKVIHNSFLTSIVKELLTLV